MKIHEYQAKELFTAYDIPTSGGKVVTDRDGAVQAAMEIGLPVALKAQVHVGGRGKAGGVKVVKDESEVGNVAAEILGLTIKDLPVRKLLVTDVVGIKTEVYLGMLIDRDTSSLVFIGCADGGVEIEQTAKTNPEKILRQTISVKQAANLEPETVMPFATKLFTESSHQEQAAKVMCDMARLFVERDCSLVEINPLIVNQDDRVFALDAKVMLDDNALFRQEDNDGLRDLDSEDEDELEAKKYGLSFIPLDGDIGCMVNGAGLAMATMDIIKHYGGNPANFLDVGGSSSPDKIVKAFQLILKNPKVKVLLINIFGGITRCDDVAKGILAAQKEFTVDIPIVIRLVGTNEDKARDILGDTDMTVAVTLKQGAQLAVEMGNKS